jgi:hypothetical protein
VDRALHLLVDSRRARKRFLGVHAGHAQQNEKDSH